MNKYQKWFIVILVLLLIQIIGGIIDFELGWIFFIMDLTVLLIFLIGILVFCLWTVLEDL